MVLLGTAGGVLKLNGTSPLCPLRARPGRGYWAKVEAGKKIHVQSATGDATITGDDPTVGGQGVGGVNLTVLL